jgi:carbon-monoxide dehydrogenase medium subunit
MYKFKYHKPTSLEESINLFKEKEFPKYLAGGMTLIPSMKQLLSSPTDLIDIQDIKELRGIYKSENKIVIGALTTHNEIANSPIIKENIRGLSYLASKIADNAVRNSGTIGGSICNADPAADYPAALLSLSATINTNSREILAKDFFIDMFETKLENSEIVTSVSFPIKKKSFYLKFSSQASKYAIVGIFGSFDGDRVSVSITGAANKVFSLEEINKQSPNQLKVYDFNALDLNEISFNSDIHASAEYRSSLIKNMLPKLINNMFENE